MGSGVLGLGNFKLKHLQMLVAIAEHRRLGMVADMFSVTQPALSRTLSELERIVGHALFERHAKGMVPTPEGEIIIQHARMMVADIHRAENELASLSAGGRGHCAFGIVMTPAAEHVSPTLNRILKQHPNIDISVTVGTSDSLLEGVVNRELDFAIGRIPPGFDPGMFVYENLGVESLRLVVAPHHELARQDVVTEKDLSGRSWVLQPPGSIVRQIVDSFGRRTGIKPSGIVSTASVLLTILLVRDSDRIGIFARPVAELLERHGLLRSLPLETEFSVPPFGLISLADRSLSPSAGLVYDELLKSKALS
jgi:DNA-binding transcriptional LysR family regulator